MTFADQGHVSMGGEYKAVVVSKRGSVGNINADVKSTKITGNIKQ